MWSIRQNGDAWEVVGPDGAVLATCPTYDAALASVGERLRAQLAEGDAPAGDGLLPEAWSDVAGIAFSEETGDGRDFTTCSWSWRDPGESLLPLMLQTETEIGHFGAQLAGFMETVSEASGVVHAGGRFYDSETGRAARDLLLGGRSFGVSVDPGHVMAEWSCIEEDADGWCTEERITFSEYEVIGLTMTPFPAFARAAIQLAGATVQADAGTQLQMVTDHEFVDDGNGYCSVCIEEDDNGDCARICGATEAMHDMQPQEQQQAVLAAAPTLAVPAAPPAAWFAIPEPEPGASGMLDVYGMPVEELLVEQPDGGLAVPLVITDDGRVFGHAARWGQCHVGFPGQCVTPPESAAAYAHFHVGEVRAADGERVATGTLTAGCDHAATTLRASDAQDHYAHSGVAWADVRATNGALGVWVCGALRPDVTPEQVRVLRASSLSGDWRRIGGALEMIGALAVNVPGFPIAREAVTASGLGLVASVAPGGAMEDGEPLALVASGIVHRCGECARRRSAEQAAGRRATITVGLDGEFAGVLSQIGAALTVLERRTRHLIGPAREDLARRIRG